MNTVLCQLCYKVLHGETTRQDLVKNKIKCIPEYCISELTQLEIEIV